MLSDDQTFQVWLTVAQTAVGALITVIAVYIAATLAIKSHQKHSVEARSRQSAEKLVFGLKNCSERLIRLAGLITYVLQPTPASIAALADKGVDLEKYGAHTMAPLKQSIDEYLLLSSDVLRTQVEWA